MYFLNGKKPSKEKKRYKEKIKNDDFLVGVER